MNRVDILQRIIDKTGARRYLEIGVYNAYVFFQIRARQKVAVEPEFCIGKKKRLKCMLWNPTNIRTRYYQLSSDEYFVRAASAKAFDVSNPALFEDLKRVREAICLNVCVDSHERYVTFALRGMVSGILDHDTDNRADLIDIQQVPTARMKTKALGSTLESLSAPHTIDCLSVDVEGAEDRVLSDFSFARYKFNCMTIERPKELLRVLLRQHGYTLLRKIPEIDAFYIHETFRDQYLENLTRFWEKYRRS